MALTLLVTAMGLLAMAGVSGSGLHDPAVLSVLKRQGAYTLMGLCALLVLARIDYREWMRWSKLLYAAGALVLLATWRLGRHTLGGARWLRFGHLQVQPSEFCKVLLILWLGTLLAPHAGRLSGWRVPLLAVGSAGLLALLVAVEPDLGTSLVYAGILVGVLYVAGLPGKTVGGAVVLVAAVAVAAVVVHVRWGVPIPIHQYQLSRLLAFLNPKAVAQGAGYQVVQSEVAAGSGRLVGTGLFSGGINNQLHYLPEPNSDFVFASISNTTGFIGACAVLLALGLVVWRALRCMVSARDSFGALVAGGIAAMLAAQTLLNAGVALGVLPDTGVPLPFFSIGGSAALADFAALGLLQSIYLRRRQVQL